MKNRAMEELLIKKLESLILSLKLGTKKPSDIGQEVASAMNKLKSINEGMAIDLMERYKKAVADSKNSR